MSDSEKTKELLEKKRAAVMAGFKKFQSQNQAKNEQKKSYNKTLVNKPTNTAPLTGTSLIELQKKIAEAKNKIASNQALTRTPVFPTRAADTKPPPLPVDESGTIDLKAMMDMGFIPRRETAISKANQRAKKTPSIPAADEKKPIKLEDVPSDFADPTKNPYFDPSMEVKIAPTTRRSRSLKFIQPGKYVDIANQERKKAQLEKLKQEITESVRKAGMQVELDVSDKVIKREPPPAVEWWDAPFLQNKTYDDLDGPEFKTNNFDSLVTVYIHHPIPIKSPTELNAVPIVKSVMLTEKERKKLRRQRRAEAQKDKRDKIRLGLLEPDAPKVKISNLMKVLGDEAIQDPTKIEARVRKEMELRQRNHEKANEQRKLTPEERRAKILNKIKDDQKISNEVAVFKIGSCSHPKHRYKIEVNAQQHQLTGMVIVHPKCNIVIVEGGPKAIKAYKKLMLRRIDWNDRPAPKNLEVDESAMDVDQPNPQEIDEEKDNKCYLVWSGLVKSKSFKKFTWRTFESEKMAREELGRWHVEHYWDAAISTSDEELAARQPDL